MEYTDEVLSHHGILGQRWGIRRYQPYGTGGYTPEEKRHNKNLAVGNKRLTRRMNYASKLADKAASNVGYKRNLQQLEAETLRKQTEQIMGNEERIAKIGQETRKKRITANTLTALGTAGLGIATMAAETFVPTLAIPAVIGADIWYLYKSTM